MAGLRRGTFKNIVLVIADALRADRVIGYGSSAGHQARLGDRARELGSFVRIANCVSSAPWTLPSCTTILTGVGAHHHGRFSHGVPLRHATIAELLPEEFHTAAFVNNTNLQPSSQLNRGFGEYVYTPSHDEPFSRATEYLHARQHDGQRFFLLVHSNIVHDYYAAAARPYITETYPDEWTSLGRHIISWHGLTPEARSKVPRFYDACVRALDTSLARLLRSIDTSDTIVCIVADHGEGLDYAAGRVHHGGRLHDDLVHVPCFIQAPEAALLQREKLVAASELPTDTSDLAPTLLSLAGAPIRPRSHGRDLTNLPLPETLIVSSEARYLYLRSRDRLNTNWRGKNTDPKARALNLLRRAVLARFFASRAFRLAGYKLIATTIQPSGLLSGRLAKTLLSETLLGSPLLLESSGTWAALELFDIASDPAERRNLLNGDLPVSELLSIMPGLATATVPTSTGERPISAFLPHHPSC